MSGVERFFERLVERPSARIFRTRLQPLQVLRRIERAMEGGRGDGADRDVVPDRFTVHVNPADLPSLAPLEDVAADLASGALAFARSHQLSLRARPRVALHADPEIRRGEVEVEAEVSADARHGPRDAAGAWSARGSHSGSQSETGSKGDADGGTRVFQVPVARAPAVQILVREPNRAPRTIELGSPPVRIGRSTECELVLRDPRVSRQHARLHSRDGLFVLTDLGSTNGTKVNGHRIREIVLGDGDEIRIGDSILVVESSNAPQRPGSPASIPAPGGADGPHAQDGAAT
jgi:hypothetical protein